MLERASQAYFFDLPQAMTLLLVFELDRSREVAVVTIYNKLTQPEKMYSLITVFSESSRVNLHKRLGALHFVNKEHPAGKFWLDLSKSNDVKVLDILIGYHRQSPDSSQFKDIRFAAASTNTCVQLKVVFVCCH